MEKKFTALRIIGTIYKIAGVLIALGTVLAVFVLIVGGVAGGSALSAYGFDTPLWMIFAVISTVIGGGLAALGVFAIGEALFLLINLEENTRFSAIILRDRFYPPAQTAQPMMSPRPNAPPLPPQQPPVV
jgi:hypothetical protein